MNSADKIKIIIALIMILGGIIGCVGFGIMHTINWWQNPDMTALRLFLTYPKPSIGVCISGIISYSGLHLARSVK